LQIDGVDVAAVTLKSLRDSIGIVSQDEVLFSASIRENVLYGRPGASDAEVWHALENANISDFVASTPDQLDTMIGEGGLKPSTGQRLALARVFLKNPPVLILDEATSGLDSEVENLIHEAVRRLMRGRTPFLIAHRLSSAVEADLIVVLDQGRMVEIGSHAELLEKMAVYAQRFKEQTRKAASRRASHGAFRRFAVAAISREQGEMAAFVARFEPQPNQRGTNIERQS
jgi:ABC-type multidrug transport system fused ATPase/permease subunit